LDPKIKRVLIRADTKNELIDFSEKIGYDKDMGEMRRRWLILYLREFIVRLITT
jgi:hypothetical protein